MKSVARVTRKNGAESGFALLEYAAGAAVIVGVLYVALNALGTSTSTYLGAIGEWLGRRTAAVNAAP